jgi:short-subunit dehydrogenase
LFLSLPAQEGASLVLVARTKEQLKEVGATILS